VNFVMLFIFLENEAQTRVLGLAWVCVCVLNYVLKHCIL